MSWRGDSGESAVPDDGGAGRCWRGDSGDGDAVAAAAAPPRGESGDGDGVGRAWRLGTDWLRARAGSSTVRVRLGAGRRIAPSAIEVARENCSWGWWWSAGCAAESGSEGDEAA